MTDRIPGAPGQFKAVVTEEELLKMQSGEEFTITMTRDDQPIVEGTPYSKAAVLPDALAQSLCPNVEDPTPADALKALKSHIDNRCMHEYSAVDYSGGTTLTATLPVGNHRYLGMMTTFGSNGASGDYTPELFVLETGYNAGVYRLSYVSGSHVTVSYSGGSYQFSLGGKSHIALWLKTMM